MAVLSDPREYAATTLAQLVPPDTPHAGPKFEPKSETRSPPTVARVPGARTLTSVGAANASVGEYAFVCPPNVR